MSILDRLLGKTEVQKEPTVKPKSEIKGGGNIDNPLKRINFSGEKKINAREIYRKGGPVAEAIDSYAQYTLTNGYELRCNEGAEALKDKVQAWIDLPWIDFESIMWQGIIESCLNKTAVQEIIPGQVEGGIGGLVTRDSSTFTPLYDKYGTILAWEQRTDPFSQPIRLEPKQLLTVQLFPIPGDPMGASLIERAYDDIMRDTDVCESTTISIHRHGHPKYHIPVGTPDTRPSPEDLDNMRREFEGLHSYNDFVTTSDVSINTIDTVGVGNVDTYSNFTLQRLACALGVPEEIMGLGRGSTEATANVRLKTFYDKIGTIQKRVARAYNRQLIDRITGVPGAVWIEFNDVSPDDEGVKAAWLVQLLNATQLSDQYDAVLKHAMDQLKIERDDSPVIPDVPEDEPYPMTPPEEDNSGVADATT
jgi:hypothetical protein